MLEARSWRSLTNPYSNVMETSEAIIGHISGRRADITKIITGSQSAIILAGAPHIGKSALIRYLQPSAETEWCWRDELEDLREELNLENTHFALVDLKPSETIENADQLLTFFIQQCNSALQSLNSQGAQEPSSDIKALYKLLRTISKQTGDGRYFLMFDTVEYLERSGTKLFQLFDFPSRAKTAQERSIALLDRSGAIHTLVDLMDEFSNFGVIFALESLPRPRIGDQFTYVSADLARFTAMTLQAFTWNDTEQLLRQPPENFGSQWALQFRDLGGTHIFSKAEQIWIRQQAGTHPYLLQQFCFYSFQFKQEYAQIHNAWPDLQSVDEKQLIEWISEPISTFLANLWKRLEQALEKSSQDTKNTFYEFIRSLAHKSANEVIDVDRWNSLGAELRYILHGEGLVRYDPFQPIHYPGALVCNYLTQQVQESIPTPSRAFSLIINRPNVQQEQVSLSELEYRLLKTLLQRPKRCPEEELIKGAWGKTVDKPAFTQRMHQLRKKLRERCEGIEIIENHYGGFYSLNLPEWFHLA